VKTGNPSLVTALDIVTDPRLPPTSCQGGKSRAAGYTRRALSNAQTPVDQGMTWVVRFVVKLLLTGVLCIVRAGLAVLDADPPED
jgi:hypothetical protein